MKGYSQRVIFDERKQNLLLAATRLVEHAFASPVLERELANWASPWNEVRCHELARAVGRVLVLPVQDGYYGFVDHSWLWTEEIDPEGPLNDRLGFPDILDVYAVGSLPMVRLVSARHTALPHVGWSYRPSVRPRDDVSEEVVKHMIRAMGAL